MLIFSSLVLQSQFIFTPEKVRAAASRCLSRTCDFSVGRAALDVQACTAMLKCSSECGSSRSHILAAVQKCSNMTSADVLVEAGWWDYLLTLVLLTTETQAELRCLGLRILVNLKCNSGCGVRDALGVTDLQVAKLVNVHLTNDHGAE